MNLRQTQARAPTEGEELAQKIHVNIAHLFGDRCTQRGCLGLLLMSSPRLPPHTLSTKGHPMSFRRIALSVALSLAVFGSAFAQKSPPITVKIIGLNDFHGAQSLAVSALDPAHPPYPPVAWIYSPAT